MKNSGQSKKNLRGRIRIPVSHKATMVIRPKRSKGSYNRKQWKTLTREEA